MALRAKSILEKWRFGVKIELGMDFGLKGRQLDLPQIKIEAGEILDFGFWNADFGLKGRFLRARSSEDVVAV